MQVVRDGVRRFGTIHQVSLGGAFVEVAPAPPVGTIVDVVVWRDASTRVILPAEARYAKRDGDAPCGFAGIGVAWGELDANQRAVVETIVARARVPQSPADA